MPLFFGSEAQERNRRLSTNTTPPQYMAYRNRRRGGIMKIARAQKMESRYACSPNEKGERFEAKQGMTHAPVKRQ